MIRIAHISDQHFDRSSRWEETVRVHKWIASDIRERGADVITLGGDLFHAKPDPEEWRAAAEWLLELADIAEVVGVYGNHDAASSLSVYPFMGARHPIAIYDTATVHRCQACSLSIACMPWPRKSSLLAAIGRPVSHEESGQIAVDALRAILSGFDQEMGDARERAFLGHCMVRGSVLHTGQPLAPGSDFEIGTEDLALANASVYLFGHIHASNAYLIGGRPGVMPGAPRHTCYGEPGTTHYAYVTLDRGNASIEMVETPAMPMVLIAATFDADGLRWTEQDVKGADVRLRFTVTADQREAARAAAAELRERLLREGAVVVKVEEVLDATVRARAPEVATATTIEDKLRAYWKAKGIELGDREPRVLGRLPEVTA